MTGLCPDAFAPGSKEHMDRFRRITCEQRIPTSGALDITHRCNLRCVHCYLGPHESEERERHLEMTTEQILGVLRGAMEGGCLYLLISGGEPLLRPDFPEVYRHARELGMVVTVFTNATLVSEAHVELFSEFPPQLVEVSLYGATKATYERVTRVPNSFERCLRGIHRLLEKGIRVGLKTVVMKSNVDEVAAIENIARDLGAPFRLDAVICPRRDRGKDPLHERIAADRAVQLEFADPERLEKLQKYYERVRDLPVPKTLFQCGAGVTNFYVEPNGILRPCLMATTIGYDAVSGGFDRAWQAAIAGVGSLQVQAEHPCYSCEKRPVCGYCPGLFELEIGMADQAADYLCELGDKRLRFLKKSSANR